MIIELAFVLATAALATEDLRQQVICAESGFSDAAERKDRDAFASFVDPDARFVAGGVSRGRDEVVQAWSGLFENADRSMRWRPKVVEVTSDGKLAISRGPYRSMHRGEDGEVVETWGMFVSTWRRSADGEWKVLFDAGGSFSQGPSESDREVLEMNPECPQDDDREIEK